ncbi:MAG: RNA-binding domain-containing protein [Candidatus Bathyarchaeia archaeon]
MRMKKPLSLSSAEVSVFSYSTEDETKVRRAVLNILPKGLEGRASFSSQALRGHHKDRIIVLKAELKSEAWAFAHHLMAHLSPVDRGRLLDELERRMDRSGNLYLRLNKQEAFLGHIELGESDPIWIKLKFRSSGRRVSTQSVKEILMTLFGGEEIIENPVG